MPKVDYRKWEYRCKTEYQKMVVHDIVEICGPKCKHSCSFPELELLGHAKDELIPALTYFERVKLIRNCIHYPDTNVPFIFYLVAQS